MFKEKKRFSKFLASILLLSALNPLSLHATTLTSLTYSLGPLRSSSSLTTNTTPSVILSMSPRRNLTTDTKIYWSYDYYDKDGDRQKDVEWRNRYDYYSEGRHTVRVRVQDSRGAWSEWDSITFDVEDAYYYEHKTTSTKDRTTVRTSSKRSTDALQVGDYVLLGEMHTSPLKWRVVSKSGSDLFLTLDSDIPLNLRPHLTYGFNLYTQNNNLLSQFTSNDWSSSNLRDWLNNDFYNACFSTSEKAIMRSTTTENILSSHNRHQAFGNYYSPSIISQQGINTNNFGTLYSHLSTSKLFIPSVKEALEWIVPLETPSSTPYFTRDAVPNTPDKLYAITNNRLSELHANSIVQIKPCVVISNTLEGSGQGTSINPFSVY